MYKLSDLINKLEKILTNKNLSETISIRISNNENFDFQINNLVKHQNHQDIKEITESFSEVINDEPYIKNFEITEKYFINLEIDVDKFINDSRNFKQAIKDKDSKTIILDYGGPNIGKPLHVGHLRSLNLGRSLYQINKAAGHNVLSDIHMGDWGMPIAQIIGFIDHKNLDIEKVEIDDLEKIYPESSALYSANNDFKEIAQSINKELNENKENVLKKWKKIKDISIDSLKQTLKILNHDFDLWMGESDVNHLIPKMINKLNKNNKISLDNGAYVSNLNSDPKILITKSDGSYLYLTTDLATVLNRIELNKFDKTLYIVDKRQKLHFEQLFKSIDYFDFGNEDYEHIAFGTINDSNGNPFRTRDGDTKKLIDLFEETSTYIKKININLDKKTNQLLSNTVLTFSDLITNRMTDYKFDLDKFTSINGKTGIYVQYAHVRAKKLIKNSDVEINKLTVDISKIDDSDLNLIRGFMKFENYFNQAINNSEPHHLADYLYEISNLFNSMYQNVNILDNQNKVVKNNKLIISQYFIEYSEFLMDLLGLEPVEQM